MSESYIGWVIPKWFLKRWTSMALLSNVPEKHWKATWLTFMHCFQILNNFLNIKVYAFWDFFSPPKFSGLSVDLWKDSCSWTFETCSQRFSDRPGFLSVSRRGWDDGILGPHSYSPLASHVILGTFTSEPQFSPNSKREMNAADLAGSWRTRRDDVNKVWPGLET